MALTRARVVSASPCIPEADRGALLPTSSPRPRDAEVDGWRCRGDAEAIAKEKGDSARWDLKYVAGGLIDIEFIAQYLQLIHAQRLPDILDTSTARVLDKARALNVLAVEDAEILRPAVQLYQI